MAGFTTVKSEESSWNFISRHLSGAWLWTKTTGCSIVGYECCSAPFIKTDNVASELNKKLRKSFFGQHIATQIISNALEGHLNDPHPGKALTFSFHGWAGSGMKLGFWIMQIALHPRSKIICLRFL